MAVDSTHYQVDVLEQADKYSQEILLATSLLLSVKFLQQLQQKLGVLFEISNTADLGDLMKHHQRHCSNIRGLCIHQQFEVVLLDFTPELDV